MAGSLLGGAWLPAAGDLLSLVEPSRLVALLLLPAAAELAFRGLSQGLLMQRFRARESASSWLPSLPAALSALFFTLWTAPLYLAGPAAAAGSGPPLLAVLAGALLLGLALGIARERCESFVGPLLLHYLGAGSALIAALLQP